MKPGDRVELIEPMEELTAALKGVVVEAIDTFPFVKEDKKMLAVLFDGYKNPCIGRTINDKYVYVLSKCKLA